METCVDEQPRLITHVETTVATDYDISATAKIRDDLIAKGLQPGKLFTARGDGAVISVARLANWLQGERPTPTRSSPFLELVAQMT